MKYRIVREQKPVNYMPGYKHTFYIQAAESDKWMGTSEWNWLTYLDDEGIKSRHRFGTEIEAISFVKGRIKDEGKPLYEVVWTQP